MIQIPLEIGDTILAGRFKNKKIIVKEITYDEYGSPCINGRSILKIRIPKLYQDIEMKNKIKEEVASFQKSPIQVKIKEVDGRWHIFLQTVDVEKQLTMTGFETKELAQHAAMTKGYSFDKNESDEAFERKEPKPTKREKTKGVDTVQELKPDKEKTIKLERLIKETVQKVKLSELEVTDPELVKKIEEMARLADAMDKMSNELAKFKRQFVPLAEEITKLMEEVDSAGDRALETKNVLVTIKRRGYEAESPKYKESFEQLYAKVNAAMKKQADEIFKANLGIKKYATTLAVQYKKNENVIKEDSVFTKIKSYFSNLYNSIFNKGKAIDKGVQELKRLSGLNEARKTIKESTFNLQDLEHHFYDNELQILKNMKTYGFSKSSVSKIRNYYDLSNILGIDSRLLKDVDLQVYTDTLSDLLNQN